MRARSVAALGRRGQHAATANQPISRPRKRWLEGPWPWLVYLPFYALPWIWRAPEPWEVAAFAIGASAFLPVYILGYRGTGARPLWTSGIVLAIGVALAPAGGAWAVFCIYAAAVAGTARPTTAALVATSGITAITAATGAATSDGIAWWLPGALLTLTTGVATVSREAFHDRARLLLASQEEVRRLAGTAERERITRDLHDVVGRTLTVIALKSDLATRLVRRDPEAAEDETRAIAAAARAGLIEVRAALKGHVGGSLAHEVNASISALQTAGITSEVSGELTEIRGDASAMLAMTLREAVTNVIRHADAKRCTVNLRRIDGAAEISVRDDGGSSAFAEGQGLMGMRQRLSAAGGALEITTGPRGTLLVATVPA